MTTERLDGPTPAGGAYSIAVYLRGEEWLPCDKSEADRVIIREYDSEDTMIRETVDVIE